MISKIDIYRTAKILLKQFEHGSIREAERRSSVFQAQGDEEGTELWSKVAEAVKWLQSEDVPKDTIAH